MKKYKIFIYTTANGKAPFITWLNSIKDKTTQRKIKLRIDRLTDGNFGDCKAVGENINELRMFFGPGYRVYYTIDEDILVILLTGGDKSTQTEDIKKAKEYLKSYKGELNEKQ